MWKAPGRPNHEITQPFTSGIVKIYRTVNGARPGQKAAEILQDPPMTLRYEEQRTGVTRYYAAKQANIQIDRVLRCPRVAGIDTQSVAETEDGEQYRIAQIQSVSGVWPDCVDLSLTKIVQKLEVIANGMA